MSDRWVAALALVHLYAIMSDDDLAKIELAKCENPLTRKFFKQYWGMTKKDRIEKWSHPLNKLEELMEPGLIEFFAQSKSLNFRKLMVRNLRHKGGGTSRLHSNVSSRHNTGRRGETLAD